MNIAQQQTESANLATQEQRRVQYATPLVDVESTEEGYTIRAEMPGVDKSGLEITVDNGELTIIGNRHPSEITGEPVYREIRNNDFPARVRARSGDRHHQNQRSHRAGYPDLDSAQGRERQTPQDSGGLKPKSEVI